jgi:hypothetical protein
VEDAVKFIDEVLDCSLWIVSDSRRAVEWPGEDRALTIAKHDH